MRHGFDQLVDFAPVDRFHNRLSGGEMTIQRADADAGPTRDFFQAYIQPDIRESRLGSI